MKLQRIEFKKPVKVIQLFKKISVYTKAEKSFELRKDEMQWNDLTSKSGYINEGELFLPESFSDKKDAHLTDLILMADNSIMSNNESATPENQYFLPSPTYRFDIFEIKKNLDLFLRYNEYDIGMPKRNDFKLAALRKGISLEIRINGKSDYTMTAGKERTYKDQQYILTYHGDFNSASILKEPFNAVKKKIPAERKIVDLIKPLW